jgi:transcriptional regulator with XRE-family HTH domain
VRRQRLGLSLRQLVARAGIAESTVTGALYGYHEGSVRTWWAIARALDMPVGELMAHLDDGLTDACSCTADSDMPPG